MNQKRRTNIKKAIFLFKDAINILECVSSDEQDALDNMPENLQESERCQNMEDNVDKLDDCVSEVEEVIDLLESIV